MTVVSFSSLGAGISRVLNRRLPGSSTHAIFAFALFLAVQLADAFLTHAGIERFGVAAEGNPLIGLSMQMFGVTAALASWKLVSCALGAVLHFTEQYLALTLLTLVAVGAAAVPWAWILAF